MNNNIKISAIIPNYNSSQFLAAAIQSLIDQTEKLTEIIIVDDGSTDHSFSIIERFMQKDHSIRLIRHEKNQGVCLALNTGIQQAIGDFVLLGAADDHYDKDMVALAKKAIIQFPSVGLICGDGLIYRDDKKSAYRRILSFPKKNTLITPEEFKSIVKKYYIGFNGGGGMLMNRQAILAAGMLYPALRWHSDWLLYFTLAFRQGVYYIDKIFVHLYLRQEGYSEKGKRQWKIQKSVLQSTVHIIRQDYPDLWDSFKSAALLPHYSPRYVFLFLLSAEMRRFFTIGLLRKLLVSNIFIVKLGRLFPYRFVLIVRKLLRV